MQPLELWHQIIRTRNPEGLTGLLAEDVVFHSPVVHTPQIGTAITVKYLAAAIQVFGNDSFRYLREIVGESDAVLEFETEIDGIIINGVDLIKWNEEGKVIDIKVMVRPLKAINLVRQPMADLLSMEFILANSEGAHERLQEWRRANPTGFLINVRSNTESYIHRAEYCPHLGDATWEGGAGWPEMGTNTKVLSVDREALVRWAGRQGMELKFCSGCTP